MDTPNKTNEQLTTELQQLQTEYNSLKQLYDKDIAEIAIIYKHLRESEEKYRNLIIYSSDPIFSFNLDETYRFVNEAFAKPFGRLPDEIIGKTPRDIFPFEEAEKRLTLVRKVMQTGQKAEIEVKVITATGNERFYLTMVDPIKNELGEIQWISCVSKDITDRKNSESILKQRESYLTSIIENQPGLLWLKDLEGRFLAVNKAFAKACGKTSPSEVLGKTDIDIWPLKLAQEYINNDTEVIDKKVSLNVEELISDHGNDTWFETYKAPIINELGEVVGTTGYAKDITERKKAEEALRLSEQMLKNVLDNFPGVVFWKDANSTYLGCNQAFANGAGLKDQSEIIGKNDFGCPWAETEAENYRAADCEVMKSGNAKMHIVEMQHQINNHTIWLDTSKLPLRDDQGAVIGVLGVSIDITERKQDELLLQEKNKEIEAQNEEYQQINEELFKAKECAEESDRLKTAFLQNMSHEIRTPMNAIMGFSSLLVDEYNNKPKLEQYSEIINQRCSDLLDIINDILDIAKIESGQLSINLEECNLSELFAELTSFFTEHQKRTDKEAITFSMLANCKLEENVIITDKIKLKQLFINLIGNAFKYTDTGKIECGCKYNSNNILTFYVTDTGIGIPPDKHKTVFDRFAQLHQGSRKNIGGTGLGLSIVKGLVTLLGGEIFLESELGKGSTFSFTIPYRTIVPKPIQTTTISQSVSLSFPNKTILLVEDDFYNAIYLKEILSNTNCTILHTEYGNEAVKICLEQHIDLVLMDIRLADIDGYKATKQIKLHKPNMVIIAQTAYASQDERQKALDAGCTDYISKPSKKDALLALIGKCLKM